MTDSLPLEGIRVLDFTTLVPGPLATLMLAEAGADVVKVERPGGGDEMRSYEPRLGLDSANFAILNRGKRSVTVDLKDADSVRGLIAALDDFDVLVEQFRPGVMTRLGLGYETVAERHPGLVYCSITGYGQDGPRSRVAGHDLNYVAEAGLLGQVAVDGAPVLPHALIADIGGGSYPAVINILLALLRRERTGRGAHLDIAMAEGVYPFLYWALAQGFADGSWPRPGDNLVTGASPRYNLYRTADGRHIAAAPLEDRFWTAFCDVIGLEESLRDDAADPAATTTGVRALIAQEPSSVWADRFAERDTCCCVVRTLVESVRDPQFEYRDVFARSVAAAGDPGLEIRALPVAIDRGLRRSAPRLDAPALRPEPYEHGPLALARECHDAA
jgi:crotonobetainyl-CoA:carnitine CoA-transferase CaiB-like acyl-CoA transferase